MIANTSPVSLVGRRGPGRDVDDWLKWDGGRGARGPEKEVSGGPGCPKDNVESRQRGPAPSLDDRSEHGAVDDVDDDEKAQNFQLLLL